MDRKRFMQNLRSNRYSLVDALSVWYKGDCRVRIKEDSMWFHYEFSDRGSLRAYILRDTGDTRAVWREEQRVTGSYETPWDSILFTVGGSEI